MQITIFSLLLQAGPPPIKIGRRPVWDVIDLDAWLDQYKDRGRAGKEVNQEWPVKTESISGRLALLVDQRRTTKRQTPMPKHWD